MPRNQREGHKLQIAALVRGAPRAGSVLSNRDIGSLEARSRQQLLGKHEGSAGHQPAAAALRAGLTSVWAQGAKPGAGKSLPFENTHCVSSPPTSRFATDANRV